MRANWLMWLRLGLAVLPTTLWLLANNRNKRKANVRKGIEGELESNEQEISGGSEDVGALDRLREPGLEPRDPVWEPKHKIFLSHSGFQKAFTEHLCEKLEAVHHFPFFDRRDDSLRKGEKFYPPLMNAAKECRVAVLVLSDEFFTKSKWPMIELNEFVKAQDSTNTDLRILPLFLKITREQFNQKTRRDGWLTAWKAMKEVDCRIDLAEWKHALSKIQGTNGIHYAGVMQGKLAFIEEVVAAVCKLVPPDVKYDVSHVQSMERLCEPIMQKFEEVEPSDKYQVRIVGLYGMGGAGKTTISRAICNHMFGKFGGKVCHVELGGMNLVEQLKTVLRELTEASPAILVNEHDKLADLLKERMHRQKVCLVLDSVWDDQIEEARMYLNAGFHDGSMVLVTSRSLDIHKQLDIQERHCMEMPKLDQEGAIDLFLHYARCSRESIKGDAEWKIVKRCVQECCFLKGKKVESSYEKEPTFHPLALKVLGSQLGSISLEVWRWEECLGKLNADKFNLMSDNVHPVFSVLRVGYDALRIEERYIFLDLALVWVSKWKSQRFEWKWLCIIHRKTEDDMKNSVSVLQRKGLLDKVNEVDELGFSIHDLYVEFAETEAQVGPFKKRRYVLDKGGTEVPYELLKYPSGWCWPSLERIVIHKSEVQSLKRAKLHLCKNVEVLNLDCWEELQELDVTGMDNLRCIVVTGCRKLGEWRGLEKLSNLVILGYTDCGERVAPEFVENLSSLSALQVLKLEHLSWPMVDMFLPDLSGCTNFQELTLSNPNSYEWKPRSAPLEFGKYLPKSVRKIDCSWCPKFLGGSPISSMSPLTNLLDLNLNRCMEIEDLRGLCDLISLQKLNVGGTQISELPDDLRKLEQLRFLDLSDCMKVRSFVGIAHATALQRLKASDCWNLKEVAPDDFIGLKQLQFLDVSRCWKLSSIVGIANATALRRVDASYCDSLKELPVDLSSLEKLEMVDLRGNEYICKLPKDYKRLAGHPESEGILNVKVEGCWGLIVPLVKKLRGPEISHAKCVDPCNCGCESMQSWIDARRNLNGAAYDWLRNVISQQDPDEPYRGHWTYLLDVGEVDHFVIRALCEHGDRGGEKTNRLSSVVSEVAARVRDDDLWIPLQWWVVVATAPCTFGVVTERAMLKPWRKTLLHYTVVWILPQFLEWRNSMINRRKVDHAGDGGSDWFMNKWSNEGIVAVLEKCKEKLAEASGRTRGSWLC